jgi:hypothetical protein
MCTASCAQLQSLFLLIVLQSTNALWLVSRKGVAAGGHKGLRCIQQNVAPVIHALLAILFIFRMHKLDFKSRRMLNSCALPTSSMHPCSPLGLAINSGIQLFVTYGGSESFTLSWCDGVSVQGCL